MKIIFFIFFCCGMTSVLMGQKLPNYEYVKVPSKFEFLKEENQYQLNALTAFLFEKKGVTVFYPGNVPSGIDPCEVLQANVHNDSGWFRTRLYFSLTNCRNETVFTSETGVSREKDFKTSYQEALRNAFDSVESLVFKKAVSEVGGIADPVTAANEVDSLDEQPEEVIIDPIITAVEIDSLDSEEEFSADHIVPAEASEEIYINGSLKYRLKRTPVGFELFKEGASEKFATLIRSGGGSNYLYTSESLSGNAFFDTSGNLVVEYLDPNSQQLVSVIYKLQDQ